jgi:hypothetical protein
VFFLAFINIVELFWVFFLCFLLLVRELKINQLVLVFIFFGLFGFFLLDSHLKENEKCNNRSASFS